MSYTQSSLSQSTKNKKHTKHWKLAVRAALDVAVVVEELLDDVVVVVVRS